MNGRLILRHQALGVRRRVDRLMRLYARLIGVYFVVAAALSLWLVCEVSLAAARARFGRPGGCCGNPGDFPPTGFGFGNGCGTGT